MYNIKIQFRNGQTIELNNVVKIVYKSMVNGEFTVITAENEKINELTPFDLSYGVNIYYSDDSNYCPENDSIQSINYTRVK
jgi:predicted kinase